VTHLAHTTPRPWWWTWEDQVQEAWAAVIEAERRCDPRRSATAAGYVAVRARGRLLDAVRQATGRRRQTAAGFVHQRDPVPWPLEARAADERALAERVGEEDPALARVDETLTAGALWATLAPTLSGRDREMLRRLVAGMRMADTAVFLGVSPSWVSHRRRALAARARRLADGAGGGDGR
jgi:DNA-directed RNA polymerase specialized sigma24 family protein